MTKTTPEILDASLRERVPDDLNLFPRIAAQLQKEKDPMQPRMKLTLAFVLIVAVFAIIFTSAPGIASAMHRIIGYIPGFGSVDQGAPVRVLAKPVSQTRDGITITVDSAILTADRAVITYIEENVPESALSHDPNVDACGGGISASLLLPDGKKVYPFGGESTPGKSRMVYSAIPANIDHVSLMLPCIMEALPGKAPENWELPLSFVPAPPDMTIVPVVELTTAAPPPGLLENPTNQIILIDRVLQIQDKLVFVGGFYAEVSPDLVIETDGMMKITDAKGRDVSYDIPRAGLVDMPYSSANWFQSWAAQVDKAGLSYPLTFTFAGRYLKEPDPESTANFELDLDQIPVDGEEHPLNLPLSLAGHRLNILSLAVSHVNDPHGGSAYTYRFHIQGDSSIAYLGLNTNPPSESSGGGPDEGPGLLFQELGYFAKTPPLHGKIKFVLSHLQVDNGTGTWQIQWSPETP